MKKFLIVGGPADPEQFEELPSNIDYEEVQVFIFDEERGFVQLIVTDGGVIELEEQVNFVTRSSDPQYFDGDVQ